MPLYNFRCDSCEYEVERLMSMKEKKYLKDPGPCPKCLEISLRSVIGKSSFKLRGEGWAKDNYTKTTDANMHTGRKT